MANKRQGKFFSFLQNNLVSVAIVLVVFLLFIKIPKFLIDINMILNLAFSIVILMVVINIPRPSDFQTFPRIVLIQTLFSLAINISSTRLILTGTLQNQQPVTIQLLVLLFLLSLLQFRFQLLLKVLVVFLKLQQDSLWIP